MSTNLTKCMVVAASLFVGAGAVQAQEIGELYFGEETGLLVMTEFGFMPADPDLVEAVQMALEEQAFVAPDVGVSRTQTLLSSLLPEFEMPWMTGTYR